MHVYVNNLSRLESNIDFATVSNGFIFFMGLIIMDKS